ncbi:MAG: hypothetical protein D6819_03685 [Gammaproteobacteria bacterium]|nr:MAG: hypothetical protein D6819_03685 [Gammaproteobacteria bacterium]
MSLDPEAVACALALPGGEVQALRGRYGELMDSCIFGDLRAPRLGALPRLRKKALALGEAMRALFADKSWIPHPREQLKSALASCLDLRDALVQMERALEGVEGPDADILRERFASLEGELLGLIGTCERRWAELLDSQYEEG